MPGNRSPFNRAEETSSSAISRTGIAHCGGSVAAAALHAHRFNSPLGMTGSRFSPFLAIRWSLRVVAGAGITHPARALWNDFNQIPFLLGDFWERGSPRLSNCPDFHLWY